MLIIIEAEENEDDRKLLTQWYQEFYRIMRKNAYDIIKDSNLANDMVNEAFIRIIKNIEKIKKLNCHERAVYFVSTIRSVSIDYIRKKKKESENVDWYNKEAFDDDNISINSKKYDSFEQKEFMADIERAFKHLSERDRNLLVYRYAWDMSSREIAEALNINESSVNTFVRRAKSKVIKILEGEV